MVENYNASRHSGKDRLNPKIWHSRFVHLRLLRKNIEGIIAKYIKGQSINNFLDLGCGTMPYRTLIESDVVKYIGIDIPGNPEAHVVVNLETNRSELPDESGDIVWSVQVLEHVSHPEKYLQECYRLLKPGGKLILCTHGHWQYHPDPIDYWRWTSEGLRVSIERQNFNIIEAYGMMGLLPSSLQLFQDAVLLSFPFVKIWRLPFQFFMQLWIWFADRFASWSPTLRSYTNKDACVFFIIAEKKL